jgi:transcriptional regulator with XRE-family HTH domain
MSSLADRLREAMALESVTQADLARACGVKAPSVNGWLSGKSKFLRGENLLRAAARLSVAPKWLAEGKGPMRLADGAGDSPAPAEAAPITLEPALQLVLEALRQTPSASRAELAQVLGLLVATGAATYAQRVTELLAGEPSAVQADVARATSTTPSLFESVRVPPEKRQGGAHAEDSTVGAGHGKPVR